MNKFLKGLLVSSTVLIVAVVFSAVLLATFFEDQIGVRVLTAINRQLKSELSVGEFDLSLLTSFPNASANLRNVVLHDAMEGSLLEAKKVSFRFGLLSLFGSSIQVHSMVVKEGIVYILRKQNGDTNYQIVKEKPKTSKASKDNSDFSLMIKKAILDDVELLYKDDRAKQAFKFHLEDAVFSGEFSKDQFSLHSSANFQSKFFAIGSSRFLSDKIVGYRATVDVNLEEGRYTFKNVLLNIEDNIFDVNGAIVVRNDFTDYDLSIINQEGNLATVLQLLPREYKRYFADLQSQGKFKFSSSIKGRMSNKENPSIRAALSLNNGRITSSKLNKALKDVSFQARFSNGKRKSNASSVFIIDNFKGYFNRELLESKLTISNLEHPKFDWELNGTVPLNSVYGLFDNPKITSGSGEIEINDFKIKGFYEDMINPRRIHRVQASGVIQFDDAELSINNEDLVFDKGELILTGNEVRVQEVKIEGAGNEWILNGNFRNVLPVLFADSLNSNHAELNFTANLNAKTFDLDRLIALNTDPTASSAFTPKGVVDSAKVKRILQREHLTKFLNGTFEANIESFNHRLLEGTDFDGNLTFNNNELIISGDVETMDGLMNLEGKAIFDDQPRLKATLICEEIDVQEFFRQSENFGQSILQHNHVRGKLNSQMIIYAFWDEQGIFQYDKLRVLADVNIKNGELVRFKMLDDFSAYVKLSDLRHIKFTAMQNWLEVKNRVIYMPVMFIQSNALNLAVNGQHTFDNKIDYKVKVNAGQILLNKFKKHDPALRPQKAKRNGWFNLHYHIKGDIDDYTVNSNKRLVKNDFIRSERRKKEIRAELLKEFGSARYIEEPVDWQDAQGQPDLEEAEEFLDVFDTEKEKESKENPVYVKPKPPIADDRENEEELEFLDVFDDHVPKQKPAKKRNQSSSDR